MKTAVMKKFVEQKKVIPEPILKKAVMSDLDPDNEEEMMWGTWLWDELAVCVFGPKNYGEDIRHYMLPSQANCYNDAAYQLMTPSNRAWLYILVENYRTKWQALGEYQKGNVSVKAPPKPTKTNGAPKENEIYHKARWTSSKGGQKKFGSWADEAKTIYNRLRKDIRRHLRKQATQVVLVETKLLEAMQVAHSINQGSAPPVKSGKRGKKKAQPVVKKELAGGWSDFEDEYEDSEEEEEEEDAEEEQEAPKKGKGPKDKATKQAKDTSKTRSKSKEDAVAKK